MEKKLVSVIVVNYNRREFLLRCLASIGRQTYRPVEVIVVDNGSSDGSVEVAREKFLDIRLIINETNQLYCRAQNQGLEIARGDYILALNNDVVLKEDFLEQTVQAMESDDRIGTVSGKVLSLDGSSIDSAGQALARSRRPIERGYKQKDLGQFQRAEYVFGSGGAAALYRRQMIEEIKIDGEFFDSSFEVFYEDLDVNWRAQNFGWKAFYQPRAVAWHVRGGTAKSVQPVLFFLRNYDFSRLSRCLQAHLIKNRYSTIIKNDSIRNFMINLPFILAYEFKLWIYILLFRPSLIIETFKNVKYFKVALDKRAKILDSLKKQLYTKTPEVKKIDAG
jgi:GT2 family glycosyltransferase